MRAGILLWSAASPLAALPVGPALRRLMTGFFCAVGATRPGDGFSIPLVFGAEVLITFLLMLGILVISNRRTIAHLTPAIAGTIVMSEVWLETHVSGTSLNAACKIQTEGETT